MKTFKQLLSLLSFIAVLFVSFSPEAQAQTVTGSIAGTVFDSENMEQWELSSISPRLRDGEAVLATFKKDRTQIIAKIRGGKIAQIGYKAAGKPFVSLPQNARSQCPTYGKCYSWQLKKCFYPPWGVCFCVCGTWISAG